MPWLRLKLMKTTTTTIPLWLILAASHQKAPKRNRNCSSTTKYNDKSAFVYLWQIARPQYCCYSFAMFFVCATYIIYSYT